MIHTQQMNSNNTVKQYNPLQHERENSVKLLKHDSGLNLLPAELQLNMTALSDEAIYLNCTIFEREKRMVVLLVSSQHDKPSQLDVDFQTGNDGKLCHFRAYPQIKKLQNYKKFCGSDSSDKVNMQWKGRERGQIQLGYQFTSSSPNSATTLLVAAKSVSSMSLNKIEKEKKFVCIRRKMQQQFSRRSSTKRASVVDDAQSLAGSRSSLSPPPQIRPRWLLRRRRRVNNTNKTEFQSAAATQKLSMATTIMFITDIKRTLFPSIRRPPTILTRTNSSSCCNNKAAALFELQQHPSVAEVGALITPAARDADAWRNSVSARFTVSSAASSSTNNAPQRQITTIAVGNGAVETTVPTTTHQQQQQQHFEDQGAPEGGTIVAVAR
ncbi:hypothetical protein GPALN_010616 [Globodera pallida]|nr:hypothetical protein GPALN_010616 [Globodera pallida]